MNPAGAEGFAVTGLQGNLTAADVSGDLTVATVATPTLSIATGGGANMIDASTMTQGETLTLTGDQAATVTVGGDLAAGLGAGTINVSGHTVADQFVFTSVNDSPNTATGHDTIIGFDAQNGKGAINDVLDFSALLGPDYNVSNGLQVLKNETKKVAPDNIGLCCDSTPNETFVFVNTQGFGIAPSGDPNPASYWKSP